MGDGCLTIEDDCASGQRVGDACTSPEDCSAAPREAGDVIETLAGPVFGASGKGSRVVAAGLLVEEVVAGP